MIDEHDDEWIDDEDDAVDADDEDDDAFVCPHCGGNVHEQTQQCPHCGDWIIPVEPRSSGKRILWIAAAILTILLMLWITIL